MYITTFPGEMHNITPLCNFSLHVHVHVRACMAMLLGTITLKIALHAEYMYTLITMLNRVCHEITGSVASCAIELMSCTSADSKCLPSKICTVFVLAITLKVEKPYVCPFTQGSQWLVFRFFSSVTPPPPFMPNITFLYTWECIYCIIAAVL